MRRYERIGNHIWIMHAEHETDRPILAAVTGNRRTLLMDAGNSPAHAALFREELTRQGVRLPDWLVLTHWHWDHTFGMAEWDIPAMAHHGTAEVLRRLAGLDWSDETLEQLIWDGLANEGTVRNIKDEYGDVRSIRVREPDIRFADRMTVDLGGVTCEIEHVGGDHSPDSCLLYVREDKTLFLGDSLGPVVYGAPRHYTSEGFLKLMDRVNRYEAEIYVESHGVPTERDAFLLDIRRWEELARLVERYGSDRVRITEELTRYLKADGIPGDLEKGLELFMMGVRCR